MADMLATPEDLASLLQQDLDTATATLVIEAATAVVQAACGQRIVQVVDDESELMGTTDSWLPLPQRPVTAVASVTVDGHPVTDWARFGSRLFRRDGWASCPHVPSSVVVVNTHGYPPGSQELQLARSAVLSLAAGAYAAPAGVAREQIDDYSVQYEAASAALEASPALKASLRRQYGQRGGLVRVG